MQTWAPADGDLLATYLAERRPHPHRPWVLANMVAGVDGCAARDGRVGSLSGPADKDLFRRLRQVADVVLVGAQTVRAERYGPIRLHDDEVSLRLGRGQQPVPRTAIVTRSLDLDWSMPLFAAAAATRPLLVTSSSADAGALAAARQHTEVLTAGDDTVDLDLALRLLRERGAGTVLSEGGPHLLGELAAAGLLDELCLTLAPTMGGDQLPVAVWPSGAPPGDFRLASVGEDDGHLFLRYLKEDRP